MMRLGEVFNEATIPDVTYVPPREARQLKGSLSTPGKHVTLVGPSGSGKSTLAQRTLKDLDIDPDAIHTFSGRSYSSLSTLTEVLGAEFGTEPNLSAIEEWLQVFELVVIDDVHHLSLSVRMELAKELKRWHELGIRLFLVGIAKTSDEILGADPELAIRNDSWSFGTQNGEFLHELMRKGEEALNIDFSAQGRAVAVAAAGGLPSVFQAICRIACVEADISQACEERREVEIELPLLRDAVVRQYDSRYLSLGETGSGSPSSAKRSRHLLRNS